MSSSLQRPEPQFKPPQAVFTPVDTLRHISGNGPLQVAKAAMSFLPIITPLSVIHDNGCGNGTVSKTILSNRIRPGFPAKIYATDINAEVLKSVKNDAEDHGWPIVTAVMPAQGLTFPDKFFTYSIMNCVLHQLSDEDAVLACGHMYRTLKPGGVAIVSVWAEIPHSAALAAAHKATRPMGAEQLIGQSYRWEDGSRLRNSLEKGGFKGRIRLEKVKAVIEVEDLENWERQIWGTRGRMISGWLPSDAERWDEAVHVFDAMLREGKDIEVGEDGNSAKLTFWAWVAVAEKGRWSP